VRHIYDDTHSIFEGVLMARRNAIGAGKKERRIAEKIEAKRAAWESEKDPIETTHRIYHGDARKMTALGNEPVAHLVVTSPPYWTLIDYAAGNERQLGDIENYERFLDELDEVWKRCYNLLVPGGRMCIVVGDVCLSRRKAGRHYVVPLHADISIRARDIRFDYLSPIYWYKIANAATEVEGNGAPFLGKPYEPNAIIKNDVEYILLLRKPGGYRHPTEKQRILSVIEKEDHERWFRQVWTDLPGEFRRDHPAPYPQELAFRLINMFSFVGDVVLDPFSGTGSTTAAAIEAHRSSIGYEIERKYVEIQQARFGQQQLGVQVEFY
jgi:DNA modification methylase